MLAVAQLRAMGKQWPDAADKVGLTPKTVRQYPSRYPGWDALVEHYRERAFDEGVREHFLGGSIEALDALRHEVRDAAKNLRDMERRAADGELDPEEASTAVDLSRAVAYAADKYLKAMGFHRYRERIAEMRAEEEIQGKHGQTVHLEGGDNPVKHQLERSYEPDEDEALEIASILHDVGALATEEGPASQKADDAEE